MRKGLTMALLTVAVAMMGLKAMAAAPVILDIPSPIVGNEGKAITEPNRFVYVDAIDLSSYVTDDQTTPSKIVWSYEVSGDAIYNINGVGPLTTEDPKTPGAKQINKEVLGGEVDRDASPATLTIRNVHLNPIGGTAVDPSGTGILAGETQVITLFASDGTTYSQKEVLFYTEMGGTDRYSSSETMVYTEPFDTGNGYVGIKLLGNASCSYTNADGKLCLTVPLTGDNYAWYTGPYGKVELVKNAVYRVRLKMNSTQTEVGTVPFWDVFLNNSGEGSPAHGQNGYGGDLFVMDNTGGANAVLASDTGTIVEMWWAPAAVLTPQWNGTGSFASDTNIWSSTYAADKDACMGFRVDDLASNGGIQAQTDFGSICLEDMEVSRVDIGQMQVEEDNVFNMATVTSSAARFDIAINATATITGGVAKIVPAGGGSEVVLATLVPGDATFDPNTPSTVPDNFPAALDARALYMVSIGMSADDDASPLGGIQINTEMPTYELITTSYVDLKFAGCGMPKEVSKTGDAPQTFVAFFYSNNGTTSTVPQFHAFRPTVMAFTNEAFYADGALTGDVKVHSIKVQKVSF